MRVKRELRVVRPALRIGQRLADHPREAVIAAERRGVDAVLDLDGVGEHLGGALADLRRGARNDVPGPGAGLGERSAVGQYPGRQVGVELGQSLGRRADDGGADDADGRRALHRAFLRGFGRGRRSGDRLVQHHGRQNDKHGQRVGAPAVGRNEAPEPGLFAPTAAFVSVGPDPARVTRQRVALGAQRLLPLVAQRRHATAPATPRVVGHRIRMAQTAPLALPARHRSGAQASRRAPSVMGSSVVANSRFGPRATSAPDESRLRT